MAGFYKEAAQWWPLFSPPAHYADEAADLLARLRDRHVPDGAALVEFGSGGGSLAFHLKPHFQLTLTDLSPGMLDVNRAVNPECEHVEGDMRTLRLNRQFDIVLVHDAVMYMTTPDDLRAAMRTAALHCRASGVVVVLPDYVRETFEPGTDCGGEDGDAGRGLRYLEWRWDPDPSDHTYVVDYAFLLRQPDQSMSVFHDRHLEGLFARADWLRWFDEAGLSAESTLDAWQRDVFMATPRDRG